MNIPKGHNIESLILVGESDRRLQRKGAETPMYYLFHVDLSDVELFTFQH